MIDIFKSTKWDLVGAKKAFGLQKDTQKSNDIAGEEVRTIVHLP